ncbi:MAG: TonB-dependent receptor [Porticoccaceae bacterium]|jgi:outer membrane receptor protein involved in Fe transport|nr:TonB-dependent receptor [Porticoccaceae bacterium]MBT4165122.1 TonB-dependent receptor [Porticoccaceae bacterium]
MFRKTKVNRAVVSVIAAGFAATGASLASAQIEEVIVTATKTSASTQDIPIAVAAITSEKLDQMGISNFEDYLIQLPGVTAGGSGPGQNTIYIRGVASTTPAISIAGVAGLAPNVAFYLDEQPLAQPGRNLDVYAADLNRVEVLAGPQGTLFGSSSQAGTVRLITNKPDPSGAYGKLKMGFSTITEGGDNSNFEAMYNLPVSDKVTLRGVVYSDDKGGYIDNVHGSRTVEESARFRVQGFMRTNGVPVSAARTGFQGSGVDADGNGYVDMPGVTFIAADNTDLLEDDFNQSKYTGARLSALISLSDDWDLLVSHTTQELEADGVFYSDPDLGDLEIQSYIDDSLKDEFDNTSWTLTGRIAGLDVVYTGAYTERTADQNIGYSDYMFVGQYLPYYICDYSVTYGNGTGTCYEPNMSAPSHSETEVTTHEIRITTDQDKRTRLTAGAFFSETTLQERVGFTYPGSIKAQGWGGAGSGPGFASPNYSYGDGYLSTNEPYAPGEIFRNDIERTDDQMGVFGELSYDISDELSVTVGARYYDIEIDFDGSAAGSFFNFCGSSNASCVDAQVFGTNIATLYGGDNPTSGIDKATADGTIMKVTASYAPTEDMMLYATISEGFRAGFLNRPGGYTSKDGLYTVPYQFDTDDMMNYEFGWKVDMMDGRMRFNGSAFLAQIDGLQTTIFDPSIANLFFSDNAADAEVTGLEVDLIWAPESVEGLTVSAGLSILDTEIVKTLTTSTDVVAGDSLAFAPERQANIQARYEWQTDSGMTAHIMPHLAHSASSYSDIIRINRDRISGWTMMGLTAGVTTDTWGAELYIDNLTDERAELARNYINDRERVSYARPRTMGVRMTYNF